MRVAFFVSDHGYGHIMRNLPVAEELIARGHEVTIVTGKSQAMIADQYLHGRAKSVVLPTDAGSSLKYMVGGADDAYTDVLYNNTGVDVSTATTSLSYSTVEANKSAFAFIAQ